MKGIGYKLTAIIASITLVIATVFYFDAPKVYALTAGPSLPTSSVYQNDGDGWSNTSSIESCDGIPAYANSFSSGDSFSGSLYTEAYGFSIPGTATINGISVAVTASGTTFAGSPDMEDFVIQLLQGGSLVGSNLGNAVHAIPAATSTITYGGVSNLWGTTWTPAQINASNFGVDLNYEQSGSFSGHVNADCVNITITYTSTTVSNGPAILTIKGGSFKIKGGTFIIR